MIKTLSTFSWIAFFVMRLCGKTPIYWFPNQVRSERRSSTRFFCPQFDRLKGPWWSRSALTPASLWRRYPSDTPPDLPRCRGWTYWFLPFFRCPDLISVRWWRHYHCARCALPWISWKRTNILPDPQQESQSMSTLIQWNNSKDFDPPVCIL